ncbi:MAG: lysine--tRNA ligase [Patescibacteria group bacterium]|jgi:lysyl-tRNA synthetase class 2
MNITAEEQVRRDRLAHLSAQGTDAYPAGSNRTVMIAKFLTGFDEHLSEQDEEIIAGRVLAMRNIGALTFFRIVDDSGAMQAVVRKEDLGDIYETVINSLDVGDIVEGVGTAYVTKTGEKSVLAHSIRILAKALKPLPEKWNGLQDVEIRYRQRELDLITNAESRNRLIVRSKLIGALRRFLDEAGFLEVETPILQSIPGGASARPFSTHHNALDADFYLRIAPELYLKRLVVGGMEKIYEIGRCFRNEGIDYAHNPEFTMLELYQAYAKKEEFITFNESMLREAIRGGLGTTTITIENIVVDFAQPFARKTFRETILESCGIDIDTLKFADDVIRATKLANLVIDFKGCFSFGDYLDALYKKTGRSAIVAPTWVFDYPADLKPLARQNPQDPSKSSCAQLVMLGAEIVNLYYHELNNPLEQRERFEEQEGLRERGSQEAQFLDEEFLSALEHGMPPTSGVGIGIDRLVAFITGAPNLKEVIAFPTLKPKVEQGGATDESR